MQHLSENKRRRIRLAGGAILLLLVALCAALPAAATDWYVSTSGSSSGDGSIGNPWDLATAFAHPASVSGGDTIYLRGGTYVVNSQLDCELLGTSSSPIKVRSYPGEWAVIDTYEQGELFILGGYTWLMDFEVKSTSTDRLANPGDIRDINRGTNVYVAAGAESTIPGIKVINLITHNTLNNIATWALAANNELYGNIIYFNGYDWTDGRGHGHGIYSQNETGTTKTFKHNIIFANLCHGIQLYSASKNLDNHDIIENISFNPGIINTATGHGQALTIGGGLSTEDVLIHGNHFYWNEATLFGTLVSTTYATVTLTNNWVIDIGNPDTSKSNVCYNDDDDTTFLDNSDNVFLGATFFWGQTTWPNNYYSRWDYPDDANFVYPNSYDPNRATIVVHNYTEQASVSVDVSGFLVSGDSYEIIDGENPLGSSIASGTYSGGSIPVPMTTTAVPSIIKGDSPYIIDYQHTPVQFGVFILKRTTGSGGNLPPAVTTAAAASPATITLPDNDTSVSVTASDPDSSPSALTYTWSKVSGPGSVDFSPNGSTSSATSSATFGTSGSYTLRVAISDGEDTVTSDCSVTVNPEVTNYAPTIDTAAAASPSTITLPDDDTTVSVSASDADQDTLTYTWSKISGPGTVSFSPNGDSSSDTSTATFGTDGAYGLRVTVSDGTDTATSDCSVTVYPSGNQAPTIDSAAWADPNPVTLPDTTTVGVTASDPDSDPLTYTWSKVSGPGTVSFSPNGDSTAYQSTATFSTDGSYTLRVTVSDGTDTATSDVTVTVYPQSGGDAWDQVFALPATLQAENYRDGSNGTTYYDTSSGNSGGEYRTDDVDIDTCSDTGGGYNLVSVYPDEWVTFDVSVATAGDYDFTLRWASGSTSGKYWRVYIDDVDVTGKVDFDASDSSGWQNWQESVITGVALTSGNHVLKLHFGNGGYNVNYLDVTSAVTGNQAPTITTAAAASPSSITLPDDDTSVSVSASDPDSGPDSLTYTWSRVSGPGTVSFSPNGTTASNNSTATFSIDGSYTLRVTVSDGADTVTSDCTVTVNAASNTAPTIDTAAAASPSSITLPDDDATLTVSASDADSGPADLIYTWSKQSGSGTVSFTPNATTTADSTTAVFSEADTYTLRVTVSDGADSVTSDVTVTVTDNAAPTITTAAAASPSTITLPDDDTTVTVSASDSDSQPAALTYTWSKQSGSGTVSFNPNGTATAYSSTASFSEADTYTLRVTVSDGDKTATSDVNVTVTDNQAPTITTAAAASPSSITLPDDDTTVSVSASDPDSGPSALTYTWSKLTGPGTVTFSPNGSTSSDSSTATFSAAGTYSVRVTVSDGDRTVTSDCNVTVSSGEIWDTRWTLPAKLEAENYRDGSNGTAYYDTSSGNNGSVYRTDDVDIETCSDTGGGYNLGWVYPDEWISYDVYVPTTDDYDITLRWASGSTAGKYWKVYLDGTDITGQINFSAADSSGWQDWKDSVVQDVSLSAGNHVLKIHFGNGGYNVNYVNVNGVAGTNEAPTITTAASASPSTITWPDDDTEVTVSANDPDNGPNDLTYTWSKQSGPGTVSFSPNGTTASYTSTATFGAEGSYTLRVTVSDGTDSVTSDVNVTVSSNVAPTIDTAAAASPSTITLPDDDTTLTVSASDSDSQPQALTYTWSKQSGPGTVSFSPNGTTTADQTTATFGTDGSYSLRVTVSDGEDSATSDVSVTVNPDASADPWDQVFSIPGKIELENYREGGMNVAYYDTTAGNSGSTYRTDDVDIETTSDTGGGYNLTAVMPYEWVTFNVDVTTSANYDITLRWASGSTQGKYWHVYMDDVDVTDKVEFSAGDSSGWQNWQNSTVQDVSLTSGTHVMKVYFGNGGYNVNYVNIVQDGGANTAPTIDTAAAASPSTITWPDDDTGVSVSASDADQDTLSYTWAKVSGPGTVSFSPNGDSSSASSTATFSESGSYTLRVTVSDGTDTATSECSVTVNANQTPTITTAAAASPSTITLPDDDTTVSVSASDPDSQPSSLTYTWSKVSGPGTVSFSPNGSTSSDSSTATFSTSGSYALRVTVSDGDESVTSDVNVTVNGTTGSDIHIEMEDYDSQSGNTVESGGTGEYLKTDQNTWAEYSINVSATDEYDITVNCLAPGDNRRFRILLDGNVIVDWTYFDYSHPNWIDVTPSENPITIQQGSHTLRFESAIYFKTDYMDIDVH